MKFRQICALAFATISLPSFASSDFDGVKYLTQPEFANLAHDFTAVAGYKAVAPAEALGITGFDVGAELSASRLEHADTWRKAGYDHASLYMPKLHVHKGLPFNVDVGASLTAVPGTGIKLIGAEIKYALIEGGTGTPAVAIRGAATRLSGVSELDLTTKSVELTVSKGFLMLTPYAGVGKVWGQVTPNVATLKKVSPDANKVFAGVNFNLGFANLATELDRTGGNQSVSVKLGFRL